VNVILRNFGQVDYTTCWTAMKAFTTGREPDNLDELWTVEHPPVFTLGRAGKPEHVLAAGDIPVIRSDRGGQVTYHGPGQLVVYTLIDVRRAGLGPRELVRRLEQGVIDCLAGYAVTAEHRAGAPGVYVGAAKVAALGLRIRGAYAYHGLALNVAMDLEPFARINPCGYAGLAVTDLEQLVGPVEGEGVRMALVDSLCRKLYPLQDIRLLNLPRALPADAIAP
jgi:lipoyl(octanoyl) transferase